MPLVSLVLPPRRYRWNFTVMGLDFSLFILGVSFASLYGVLPLFVQHLSGSNLALGAISSLRAAGLLPPLLVARFTERLLRKKPFVVGCTLFERLPYLVLAVATPALAGTHPTRLLWLFFAMLALTTLAAGVATPGWLDLLARMLPADWRGRFFGLWGALGGVLGVAGSAAAAALLQRFSWSVGSALCFACAFVCLTVSFLFILLGREPAPAADVVPPPPRAAGDDWRRLPALVRRDRNLRWYLAALALITSAGAAASFYIVDAKRALRLTDAEASRYAVALLAASTVGNVLWGYVGDRGGHKRVVIGGALCTGLAALLALVARAPAWGPLGYGVVFLLVGLGSSGLQLTALTFIVDFAPDALRPTYIGLATMTQAPFALGAPLLGALIADRGGYPTLFALAAVLALAGTLLVLQRVHDPRMQPGHRPAPVEAG